MMTAPMVPVPFRLGSITVYSFGVMMLLAFLLAGHVVSNELERIGKDANLAWSISGTSGHHAEASPGGVALVRQSLTRRPSDA